MAAAVTAYIGLGSNLDDPQHRLEQAVAALARLPQSRLEKVSSFYRNPPLGPAAQPDYVNAVAALHTTLEPLELLDTLQAIERAQGRIRDGARWGPRTLDLDLLLYGDRTLDSARLRLPHPHLHERAFVVVPLAEIAPAGLEIPGRGRLDALRAALSDAELRPVRR